MYETFDHTADLGLRVRAADLSTLFAEAGLALLSSLVEDPGAVRPERRLDIELPADDVEYLLFDWLKALLYRFEKGPIDWKAPPELEPVAPTIKADLERGDL